MWNDYDNEFYYEKGREDSSGNFFWFVLFQLLFMMIWRMLLMLFKLFAIITSLIFYCIQFLSDTYFGTFLSQAPKEKCAKERADGKENIHYSTKFGLCPSKAVKELRHKHKPTTPSQHLFRSSLRLLPCKAARVSIINF